MGKGKSGKMVVNMSKGTFLIGQKGMGRSEGIRCRRGGYDLRCGDVKGCQKLDQKNCGSGWLAGVEGTYTWEDCGLRVEAGRWKERVRVNVLLRGIGGERRVD